MIQLPSVTLIALTGKNIVQHRRALDYSCRHIVFGDVKLIQKDSSSIDEWNRTIVYDLTDYVDTPHRTLVHDDGYIIHPELWKNEWLEYDFIGAPWPLPRDEFSYRTPEGELVRVGNSVGLRSKKLLDLPRVLKLEWKSYYGNTNEDGFLCVHNRKILQENGCKFAPLEVARVFSKENTIPENEGIDTFMFHSRRLHSDFLKEQS